MKKKLTAILLCATMMAAALTGCTSGSGTAGNSASSASTPASSASSASSAASSAASASEASSSAEASEEGDKKEETAAIKDGWQEFTILNPVLGKQLTFYLPEADWTVNKNTGVEEIVSADTEYQFRIDDDLQAEVHLQAYSWDTYKAGDRAAEKQFNEETDYTKPLETGNGYPAAVRESDRNNQYYVNMGDLAGSDDYYLQAYFTISKNDDDAFFAEIEEALLASPVVSDFDAGFAADRITDDTETLSFPASVSVNGNELALSSVLAGKAAVRRVQGVYEQDGVTYTFYTGGFARGGFDMYAARREETTYGALRAAEERKGVSSHSFSGGAANAGSYAQLDSVIEMEDGAFCYNFFCDIAGVEEVADSHYETAAQLITALAENAEYHAVDEALATSGLF